MSKTGQISERCYNSEQSWYYQWTGVIGGRKFLVDIRRNAYFDQSWTKVSIYDAIQSEWKQIVYAPITECDCKSVEYWDKNITVQHFHKDRDRLLTEATQVCLD